MAQDWEHLQEQAIAHVSADNPDAAEPILKEALALAREEFSTTDLRLSTSLANLAHVTRRHGKTVEAETLFQEALNVWDESGPWLDSIKPEQRARSSTFHYRMEAKNRDAYDAGHRKRLKKLAAEGREAIQALSLEQPTPSEGLPRWEAEKAMPPSEQRNLLAAVLLVIRL